MRAREQGWLETCWLTQIFELVCVIFDMILRRYETECIICVTGVRGRGKESALEIAWLIQIFEHICMPNFQHTCAQSFERLHSQFLNRALCPIFQSFEQTALNGHCCLRDEL